MGFRIILVSVVAALGLTLPTGKQVGEWHGAARAWVVEKFEDWDNQVLVDEDAYVVAAEPALVPSGVVVATAPPAPVVTAVAPTVAPPTPPAPAVAGVTTSPRVEPATGLDSPMEPTDLVEADLDFAPAAAPAPTRAPAPAVLISDAAFDAAQGEFVTGFVAERAAERDAATVAATDASFDAAQEDFVDGVLAADAAALAARNTEAADTAAGARTETVAGCDNLYEGLAYALNRESEGLEPAALAAADRAGEAKPSDRDGRLTNAVRLTRDAVYAWANLLHGPAVVTIGH